MYSNHISSALRIDDKPHYTITDIVTVTRSMTDSQYAEFLRISDIMRACRMSEMESYRRALCYIVTSCVE